jgi:type IV pilus assembly protein PilQ
MNRFDKIIGRIIQFVAVLCAVGSLTAHAAQVGTDAQNSIQALSLGSGSNGQLVIKVSLKNALAALPHDFTISTPPRIAFDFPNTTNGLGKSVQEFNVGDLRSANIVQAGNRTRLVVNLNQMMAYEARIDGNDLLITLQGTTGAGSVVGSRFAEAKPGEQGHSLRDVDFHRGQNGEGRIQVDLSDPNVGIDIKQQGTNLIVDFLNTRLPRNLQRKLDVVDFGTPVNFIDTFTQGNNVRMVIEPKGNWEHAAYQTDNRFIVEVKPVTQKQKEGAEGKTGYTGEKLTLNFQNISVREALNVIADFTGLNIVISDTVTGNLTLRLKDVPWDQALDIILQSRGLDMRRNGNVIQVAPREEIAAREKLALAANQEISDLEATRTESFQLSYQKAADIIALLTNDKQRILSKRGSAVADARTNTLFVQDTPSRLEEVRNLISQIDVPVRQVMIEARFVSAGDTFNRTLGGRLGYGSTAAQGFAIGSNTPTATRGSIGFGSGNSGIGNVNVPGTTLGTGGLTFSLFNPAATKTLTLELTASELDGRTKNIASPRVVTADKTEATISSGVQIPYQEATSSGATSIAFKDATLSLKVTPQITPDNHINMKLDVNQDTVGTVYNGVPSINTKKVTTQVLVDNGGTVVIGGVYTQDIANSTQKVPLLGDVPLVGWLFKTNTNSDNRSELLVFITPKILKESLSLD